MKWFYPSEKSWKNTDVCWENGINDTLGAVLYICAAVSPRAYVLVTVSPASGNSQQGHLISCAQMKRNAIVELSSPSCHLSPFTTVLWCEWTILFHHRNVAGSGADSICHGLNNKYEQHISSRVSYCSWLYPTKLTTCWCRYSGWLINENFNLTASIQLIPDEGSEPCRTDANFLSLPASSLLISYFSLRVLLTIRTAHLVPIDYFLLFRILRITIICCII